MARLDAIRSVLPESMWADAERLVKRAVMTVATSKSEKVRQCTVASLVAAVIQAAEFCLAIDGKLAYVVPYNCKVVDPGGRERWEVQAQMQLSYLGILFLARRSKQILDAWAFHVYEHDLFRHGTRSDGSQFCEHTCDHRGDRGALCGVAAVVLRGVDGGLRYDYMTVAEIEAIRQRSKAKDDGPWVTDTGEMQKKTVLRRILKLFSDDPVTLRAFEVDDAIIDAQFTETAAGDRGRKARPSALNQTLGLGYTPAEPLPFPGVQSAGGGEAVPADRGARERPRHETTAERPDGVDSDREPGDEPGAEASLRAELTKRLLRASVEGIVALRREHTALCGPQSTLDEAMRRHVEIEYERLAASMPPEPPKPAVAAKSSGGKQGELLS